MTGGLLPFKGDTDDDFACWTAGAAADPPATRDDPVAINGVAAGFLGAPAAEAYDAVAVDVEFGAGMFWLAGEVIRQVVSLGVC